MIKVTRENAVIVNEINRIRQKLKSTDYQAIKYAEGLINDEDYALIKAQRQSWRDEINALEEQL